MWWESGGAAAWQGRDAQVQYQEQEQARKGGEGASRSGGLPSKHACLKLDVLIHDAQHDELLGTLQAQWRARGAHVAHVSRRGGSAGQRVAGGERRVAPQRARGEGRARGMEGQSQAKGRGKAKGEGRTGHTGAGSTCRNCVSRS